MTEHNLIVTMINIADVLIENRIMGVDKAVVETLTNNINQRGLRTPIEVVKRNSDKIPYRLVTGNHRITACKALGWDEIPAFVIKGNYFKLRMDEISENFSRNNPSKLARAVYMNEAKSIWQEAHPETKRGGDHRSDEFQTTDIVLWSEVFVENTTWGRRTLESAAKLGAAINSDIIELIKETNIADNQSELEALVKNGPDVQLAIANTIAAGDKTTVKSALAHVSGVKEAPKPQKTGSTKLSALIELWDAADKKTKSNFRDHIDEGG